MPKYKYFTEDEIRRAWRIATDRISNTDEVRPTIDVLMGELKNPTWQDNDTITVKQLRDSWARTSVSAIDLVSLLNDIRRHADDI